MTSPESSAERPVTPAPPPGWYRDPRRVGVRWWDGQDWTQHWQGDDPDSLDTDGIIAGPIAPTSPSRAGTIVGLGGAVVLFFATFSRWMTLDNGDAFNAFDRGLPWFLSGASYNPLDPGFLAHGVLLILAAIAAGVFVVRASRRMDPNAPKALLLIGGFVVLLAVVNALSFRASFDDLAAGAAIGVGLWLSLFSGGAIAAAGSLLTEDSRGPLARQGLSGAKPSRSDA